MSKKISSFELFKRLQPRFREITWHGGRFITEEPHKFVIDDRILQNENLLLAPGYLGQKDPIPCMATMPKGPMYQFWWSDYGTGREDQRPSFQFREGGLAFNFAFDPSAKEAMKYQLEKAAARALYEGPFKGRRFFMGPKFETRDKCFARAPSLAVIPVGFYADGYGPIPGLHLGEATAHDWTFFIPEGPERTAIQTVIDLESAQDAQEEYHGRDPVRSTVQELRVRLEESLSAIAM